MRILHLPIFDCQTLFSKLKDSWMKRRLVPDTKTIAWNPHRYYGLLVLKTGHYFASVSKALNQGMISLALSDERIAWLQLSLNAVVYRIVIVNAFYAVKTSFEDWTITFLLKLVSFLNSKCVLKLFKFSICPTERREGQNRNHGDEFYTIYKQFIQVYREGYR